VKSRLRNRWRRFTIARFARREFRLPGNAAYVSFTFDDFPRSALLEGGRILEAHGVRGTYFVSFQCLGHDSASGRLASFDDVAAAVRDGHELGCHTFEHLDGTTVSAATFERSIALNRAALMARRLGSAFDVFAYPLNGPTLSVKRAVSPHFSACRFGGQSFNEGVVDLNLLNAYFLDARSETQTNELMRTIELNAARGGWLIIATHDVADNPSEYGCEGRRFAAIVARAVSSGARVLPMTTVCRTLGLSQPAGDAV
jgi:peptidoglycan/xylan/chitin deacetylase (PgdA/CDA1 family)